MAVSIRWTGLGTGLWDWTEGLDSQKVSADNSADGGLYKYVYLQAK